MLGLLPQTASAQEVRFRINASWVVNEFEPSLHVLNMQMSLALTLKNGKTVQEDVQYTVQEDKKYRNGNRPAYLSHQSKETDFGKARGERVPVVWKVVNERTLARLVAWPSHTFAIWIRTNSDMSCTATLEWRLKPGFQAYEGRRRNMPIRYSEPSSPSAQCEVL